MATGLNPITVAEAGPIMAGAMGLSWVNDRLEVVENLHRYRLLLYTDYDKFKLFDDSFHCICVSNFNQCCGAPPYQGFTLPNSILAPEAVYDYGASLTLRSRWREAHTGLGVSTRGRIEAVMMAEQFATERDLQKLSKIKIYTECEEDSDKIVYVDVLTDANKHRRIAFNLIHDAFAVSPARIKKIISVSLPPERHGSVTLMQTDGYVLSEYVPWESVPSYRRMKVMARCTAGVVLVQGTLNYKQKPFFDHDIIEVGNDLIIESAGRYLKYGGDTSDPKEIKAAEYHLAKMKD